MTKFYRVSGSLAGLSLFGSLCVIISYLAMPVLRKHPTNMVFYLSICDLFFALKFVLTGLYPHSQDLQNDTVDCYLQAGWAQFWGIASISWNGMISLNLIINLRNHGFAKTSNLSKFYHLWAWGLAALTTGLIFTQGQSHIGNSGDGTCWIQSGQNPKYGANDPYRLFFFVPLLAYFGLSVASLIYMQTSSTSREWSRNSMFRMSLYVIVFVVCWLGPVIHRIGKLVDPKLADDPVNPTPLQFMDAIGITIQGFANAAVWLANPSFLSYYKKKLSCFKSEERAPMLLDDSNDAIRNSVGSSTSSSGGDVGLEESKIDINKIDTHLRKNIITSIIIGIDRSLKTVNGSELSITMRNYSGKNEFTDKDMECDGFDYPIGYTFVDYAPIVFSQIRYISGVNHEHYMTSMAPSNFLSKMDDQLLKFSEGRSSSFFIFSPDKNFILKTLTDEEAGLLLSILPNLYSYLTANPKSLITRFYGLHSVKVANEEVVKVVVMSNVFNVPNVKIDECYDLKGSWINRSAGKAHQQNKSKVGMDLDLDGRKMNLPSDKRAEFMEQISKDALFLCSLNIMDYSLLLGIHKNKVSTDHIEADVTPDKELPNGCVMSVDRSETYFFGVIDVLQLYNRQKKMERFFKVYLFCKDKDGVSVIQPHPYAKRFITGMNNLTS